MPSQPVFAIAYFSRARRPFTSAELDELVVDAATQNALSDVTGVLLYEGDRFFQYLEGPEHGVRKVYQRIVAAQRHDMVTEAFSGQMPERYFAHWHMSSRRAEPGTILHLGAARWDRARAALPGHAEQPEALRELLAFWRSAHPGKSQ